MSVIDPDGLFNGDRLRQCSNAARLYWPYFFLASNGYGRIEINYHRLVSKAFSNFSPVPSEAELMRYLKEYESAHLLFLYQFKGQLWGQWDTDKKYLNKYQTAADKSSPEPPADAFKAWKDSYHEQKQAVTVLPENLSSLFGNVPESSTKVEQEFLQDLPLGDGVGVGVVVGEGETKSPSSDEMDSYQLTQATLANLPIPGSRFLYSAIEKAIRIEAQRCQERQVESARRLTKLAKLFLTCKNPKCSITKFFEDGLYLQDPKTWERGYVEPRETKQAPTSRNEQRNKSNRENMRDAARTYFSHLGITSDDSEPVEPGCPDGSGGVVLAGRVKEVSEGGN